MIYTGYGQKIKKNIIASILIPKSFQIKNLFCLSLPLDWILNEMQRILSSIREVSSQEYSIANFRFGQIFLMALRCSHSQNFDFPF